MSPQPPPPDQWQMFQAEQLRRQTSALTSIQVAAWVLVALWGLLVLFAMVRAGS